MKKWPKRVLLALCAGFAATPAVALQQGDWLLRLGPAWVLPNADSSEVTGLPGSGVDVDNAVTLGFTVGYMVTDNLGIELLGVVPPEHDLEGDGSIAGLGDIGDTKVLPPTLSVQYHFLPDADFNPFVGIGLNYTTFFSESASPSLEAALGGPTSIELDDSFGVAGQIGVDWNVRDNWYGNATLWYVDMNTEATLNTGGFVRTVDVDIDPWIFMLGVGVQF